MEPTGIDQSPSVAPSAVWATSPAMVDREGVPWLGIFTISVTAELRRSPQAR